MTRDLISPGALKLRLLAPQDEAAFLEGYKEWDGEDPHWHSFDYRPGMDFSSLLAILARTARGQDLAPGRVAASMYYGFVEGKIVGRVSIRHALTPSLLERGGHIGWAVAPRFRRQGYAQAMIEQSVPLLLQLGIKRVLITCATTNEASKRLIVKLGGVLENSVVVNGEATLRYWVELA